jgi:uncharacterized membrane protein
MEFDLSETTVLKFWTALTAILTISSTILSIVFPERFFTNFIWKYFWGPIVADSYGASQVGRINGNTNIPSSGVEGEVLAEPGYTVISTISYAIILVFGLVGVINLLKVIDLDFNIKTVISFIPFIVLGGLLRVTEDMNVFLYQDAGDFVIPFPLNTVLISPIIYILLFIFGISLLVLSSIADNKDYVRDKDYLVFGIGSFLSTVLIVFLFYISTVNNSVEQNFQIVVFSLAISLVVSVILYFLLKNYTEAMSGVKQSGFALIFAHSLDGIVNVISLDWLSKLGIQANYQTKHVVNNAVREITENLQPNQVTELIGITWPFIFIKLGVALFLIWILNEEFFEENKKLAVITLIVGIAVGLGPAIRDLVRVTFGI